MLERCCLVALGLLDDSFERVGMVGGKVGEDFTVQLDVGFGKQADELAVRDTVEAGTCVDPLDPQGAELAFFGATVAVSINEAFLDLVFGDCPHILFATEIAFG